MSEKASYWRKAYEQRRIARCSVFNNSWTSPLSQRELYSTKSLQQFNLNLSPVEVLMHFDKPFSKEQLKCQRKELLFEIGCFIGWTSKIIAVTPYLRDSWQTAFEDNYRELYEGMTAKVNNSRACTSLVVRMSPDTSPQIWLPRLLYADRSILGKSLCL